MKQVSGFVHKKWSSLLLSVLLTLPIAFFTATVWFQLLKRIYSLKDLVFAAFVIFILLAWVTWSITNKFLEWLKNKQNEEQRDFILWVLALITIAAVYYGWSSYGYSGKHFPNMFLSRYEIKIASSSNAPGNICILEIKNQDGKKIRPENNAIYEFSLTGDWVLDSEGCQYLSRGDTSGSFRFSHIGIGIPSPSEFYHVLFRQDNKSGKALIRIKGEERAEVDLHKEQEENKLIYIGLYPSHIEVLLWHILRIVNWTIILIILVMILFLLLRNVHLPPPISALVMLIEKHPWVSLVPIAISVFFMFWPSGSYPTASDAAYYLSLAKNLYHGNGYVNPDLSPAIYRGPVFPVLISLSYMIFGESFRSAVVMERIFWVLTILITYILGKQLFNHRVGLLASLFVLSSSIINIAFRVVQVDGPLIFIILALQWLFWRAFSKQRGTRWYVLMGLLMGTAYLLKQTAIFIAPLPFISWLVFSEYRTRKTLKKLFIYYSVFALFFFGWMGYVYLVGGSPKQVAADLSIGFSIVSRLTSILNVEQASFTQTAAQSYSISLPQILATYYTRDVAGFFRIAPIMFLALGFTLFQAVIKKSKPDAHLGMGLLLFSSLIPIQVVANFGYRQNLYFFIVGMICIAALIERLFNKVSPKKMISSTIMLTVALSLVFVQTSGGNYGFRPPHPVTNKETLNYFSGYQAIADWVDENIESDEKILIDEREGDILHILTRGNRRFEIINNCRGEQWYFWPAVRCKPPYISFWIYNGKTDPDDPRDILSGLSEPFLLSTIQEKDVKYIIVTPGIYSLYYYLKIHPDFEEVSILRIFAVFRINQPVQPIAMYPNIHWETCIGQGTPEYLKNLEESNPARYQARLRDEIEPWMGLTEQDLKTIQNWQGCQFEAIFPGEYRLP